MNPKTSRSAPAWRPFSDRGGSAHDLQWSQPGGRGYWELLDGDQRLSSIERRGALRERWTITGPSGLWTLKKDWRGRRRLQRPGEREAAVLYEPAWRGGRLRLRDATRLLWKRLSMLRTEWAITNEEERPFVTFQAIRHPLRVRGSVVFDPSARRLADVEPLLLLGWILILDARAKAH